VAVPQRSNAFRLAKRAVQALFALLAAPRLAIFALARALLGERAFLGASESIARVPGLRGAYLRQAFYRYTLDQCGQDVYFGWCSVFSMTAARVGDECYIGRFCSIGFADLGPGVMLADGVQVLSGGNEHGPLSGSDPLREQAHVYQRTRIGANAWIGAGAIIMADVGEGAVVGAGAVVTRPVLPFAVAVGIPARSRDARATQEHPVDA
jgi:acetyltransferase-like isoleucine patch superfamily enzyme